MHWLWHNSLVAHIGAARLRILMMLECSAAVRHGLRDGRRNNVSLMMSSNVSTEMGIQQTPYLHNDGFLFVES